MNANTATAHLQVIRTLMERSALYRRALGPVMGMAGLLGLGGAIAGLIFEIGIHDPIKFVGYWYALGILGISLALLVVRRQAFRQSEAFWSPPTRRVAQALTPALAVGFAFGLVALRDFPPAWIARALPCLWVTLYGCALHAAGFFMPRGIRLFGLGLILVGFAGWFGPWPVGLEHIVVGHATMGSAFGLLHLAYGLYLFATERSASST